MRRLAIPLLLLMTTPALAHVGHTGAFSPATGFAHPFSGLDHIAAMVAVGLWAAMGGGRRIWLWPAAFVAAMTAAAVAAHAGLALPYVEPAIAATVLVLGLLVAAAVTAPAAVGAVLVALFAIAHGHAHGAEAPAGSFAGYVAGFAAATAILHMIGLGAGLALHRYAPVVASRALGGATALLGLVLLVR